MVSLVLHQFRFDVKRFWRDPASLFFSLAFPLIFLLVFSTLIGSSDETAEIRGRTFQAKTYFVPGIMAIGIVSTTFVNLSISITASRERGLLKRIQATPLSMGVLIAARVTISVTMALLVVLLTMAVSALFYGVDLPGTPLVGLFLALVIGSAAFCSLAFALTTVIPNAAAASAAANMLVLPLSFISGVFVRNDNIPRGAQAIADLLPVRHLFTALLMPYHPNTSGAGVQWQDLGILGAWGLLGLIVALRFFRWVPFGEGG